MCRYSVRDPGSGTLSHMGNLGQIRYFAIRGLLMMSSQSRSPSRRGAILFGSVSRLCFAGQTGVFD